MDPQKCLIIVVDESKTRIVDATALTKPKKHTPAGPHVVEHFCRKIFHSTKDVHSVPVHQSKNIKILEEFDNSEIVDLNIPTHDQIYDYVACLDVQLPPPAPRPAEFTDEVVAKAKKQFADYVKSSSFLCPGGKTVIQRGDYIFEMFGDKESQTGVDDAEMLRLLNRLHEWKKEQHKIQQEKRNYFTSFIANFPYAKVRGWLSSFRDIKTDVDAHQWLKDFLGRLQHLDSRYFPWSGFAQTPSDPKIISLVGDGFAPMVGHRGATNPTHAFPGKGVTIAFNSNRVVLWSEKIGIVYAIRHSVHSQQKPLAERLEGTHGLCLQTMAKLPPGKDKSFCDPPKYWVSRAKC